MTVGWIPQLIIGLGVFAMCFIVVGVILDDITATYNDLNADLPVPHSTASSWTMDMLIKMIGATPFTALITYAISGYMNATQEQSGDNYG